MFGKRDLRCDHCGRLKSEAYAAVSYHCAPPFTVQMHSFTGRHPADRKPASKHYQRMAKKAQRQAARRHFFNAPHFAFIDMIAVAIASALLGIGVALFIL